MTPSKITFSRIALRKMTVSRMTFCRLTVSSIKFSKLTVSRETLIIMKHIPLVKNQLVRFISSKRHSARWHSAESIQENDTQKR
jgi:hypothetical protein